MKTSNIIQTIELFQQLKLFKQLNFSNNSNGTACDTVTGVCIVTAQWCECWMRFELLRSKRCARVEEVRTEAINGSKCVRGGGMNILHGPSDCEHCACSST
jgi:hypothetical protein